MPSSPGGSSRPHQWTRRSSRAQSSTSRCKAHQPYLFLRLLNIIDFDEAFEVQGENMEIEKYRGTEDWTVPEIGQQD